MKDKTDMQQAAAMARGRRGEDGLGPNTDIGMKLRALYSTVQEETIPDRFLELLEKLDTIERQGKPDAAS